MDARIQQGANSQCAHAANLHEKKAEINMSLCDACEQLRTCDASMDAHADLRLIEPPFRVEYGAHERYRCIRCDHVATRFKSVHHSAILSNRWIIV
jgi:hypothetical protein